MYGWRARIGLMVPSLNITMEPELYALAPEGVSIHTTRLLLRAGTEEDLLRMIEDVSEAAELLATAHVNIIVFGCTTGSLIKGIGWDQQIIRQIEDRTSIPAITTGTAIIEAFKELSVKRASIATPYTDSLNQIEKKFFEAHGIKVVNIKGLGYTEGEKLHREPVETTYKLAKEVDCPEADCIFISCTDFKSLPIIQRLEEELDKPVFSSNTATAWTTFKKLKLRNPIKQHGELLRKI